MAYLSNSRWLDGGNSATTGNTSYGSVTSETIIPEASCLLTLGNSAGGGNVLPIHLMEQEMNNLNGRWICRFRVLDISAGDKCFIEWSADGSRYETVSEIALQAGQSFYEEPLPSRLEKGFFRIVLTNDGNRTAGKSMRFGNTPEKWTVRVLSLRSQSLAVFSNETRPAMVQLFDGCGRLLYRQKLVLQKEPARFRSGKRPFRRVIMW
ncbi:MAG: hypothetical protein QM664_10470 [Flavihumibacter sp.]